MSCRYRYSMLLGLVFAALLTACGSGIQTGTLDSKFSGVGSAVAISPTAVKLSWTTIEGVTEYQIYEASQPTMLQKTVFNNMTIENLTPDTDYVFKVVGVSGSDRSGIDKEARVHTWPRFEGVQSISAGSADNSFQVAWDYSQKPLNYLLYVSTTATPTAATTSNWQTVSYSTTQKNFLLTNLQPSTTYYVVVHAQYRQDEFERSTKSVSARSGTTFKTPLITMPKISIGSLPFINVDPQIDATHSRSGFRSQAYWKGNPVSDPLIGKGTLTFLGSAGLPIGKVDGISLKVDYGTGATAESMTIDGLSTYIKGIADHVETPSVDAVPQGASYFGKVLARGDFNCDGGMDLAVGVPDISLAQFGVSSPAVGAVFIYYSKKVGDRFVLQTSKTPRPDPVIPGEDPQVITFDDLATNSHFGASLAAGNMNGDTGGTGASCDDLAVGAPDFTSTIAGIGGYYGAAFVFFGSERGLRAPSHIRDMPKNVETCDGRTQGASCVAAMIIPDPALVPSAALGSGSYAPYSGINFYVNWKFGASLAFVGDFDANGYEDLAIGAPGAPFAGAIPTKLSFNGYLLNVGFVNVYPGSKFGLGKERFVGPGGTTDLRYITIFPPIPEEGMAFGSSVAGGADVDGKYKVRYNPTPGVGSGSLVGGADLVIGAPGFKYQDYTKNPINGLSSNYGPNASFGIVQPRGGAGSPASSWIPKSSASMSDCTNYYGWPQAGSGCASATVGTAFVYYGNGLTSQASADETDTDRTAWLACGSRSLSATTHFSCLNSNTSFDMLFPRDPNARRFGSAVALLGDPSHYMPGTNNVFTPGWDGSPNPVPTAGADADHPGSPYVYYSDSNQDGYADIAVLASDSAVGSNASVGTVNLFFGNPYTEHLFGGADFYNAQGLGSPTRTDDYSLNMPLCTTFKDSTFKGKCRPVVLSSGSLSSGAHLGQTQSAVAVADVTGDGVKDLIVGAPGESTVGSASGAVLVFPSLSQAVTSGAGGGLMSSYKKFYGLQTSTGDNLGTSVTGGDFNGDYYSYQPNVLNSPTLRPLGDVFGGAPYDGAKAPSVGTVLGFMSNDFPLPSVMNTSSNGAGAELILNETLASFQQYGLGETTIIGDINGDLYDDAVSKIVSYGPGGVAQTDAVIYFGSPLGLITTSFCKTHLTQVFKTPQPASACLPSVSPALGITNPDINLPQKIVRPSNLPANWYLRAVRAGDVNHDGYGDVLFITSAGSGGGTMTLFFGARGGLLNVVDPTFAPSVGDPQIVTQKIPFTGNDSAYDSANYGVGGIYQRDMVTAGDFNGDGFMDIAIGVPTASSLKMNESIANGGDGQSHFLSSETPPAGVNPLNGWNCSRPTLDTACSTGQAILNHGMFYVLYGSTKGYQTPAVNGYTTGDWISLKDSSGNDMPGILDLMDTERADAPAKPCDVPTSPDQSATCSMTYMRNPVFENIVNGYDRLSHEFGSNISAIKVDTDAYDDLLVSSPRYDDISCWASGSHAHKYGRIWAFYGSSHGLVASVRTDYYNPARTGACPIAPDADPATGIMPGSKLRALAPFLKNDTKNGGPGDVNNNYRLFGRYMANVGDVNGDGIEDFIVAVPQESLNVGGGVYKNPGAMYLYYGPLCPADNDALASQTLQNDYGFSPNYLNTQTFMASNAPAWVPGDRLINIPTEESSPCKVPSKAMKPLPLKFMVLGADTQQYGIGLSSTRLKKGDFNGDGIDDVLVGSPYVDDSTQSLTSVGGGVIFFGHPDGLMVSDYPTLSLSQGSATDSFRPLYVNPKNGESNAQFFRGNVSVGDVNNDKTADYMVTSRTFSGVGATKGIWIGTFFVFY